MLSWAGAPLHPQQDAPPSCPPGSRTGQDAASRGQVHPSHKPVMAEPWGQPSGSHTEILYQVLREDFRLIHKGWAVPTHIHPALTSQMISAPSLPHAWPIT